MPRKGRTTDSGQTILVVDDQAEVLESVRAVLEHAGHRVVTAQAAGDALAAMGAADIDLVLVDHVMPEVSGEALIQQIRSIDPLVPIVLHTGRATDRPVNELIAELGIQGYHEKADGPEKLLVWIEAGLKTHGTVEALRRRADQQRDLISHVSHELRSPLQRLGGFTDLLLDGSYGELPPAARSPLLSLARTAHDLTRVVTNFLTHARIEARALGIERRRICVEDLVAELRAVADTLLADRPVRLAVEVGLAPPALRTDGQALRAILYNLLDNAAKFTERGQITIFIAREGSAVRIAVADTGAGIPADELPLVFQPFHRGGTVASGVGLGLALARQLATMLGGQLTVQSQPGRGSVFSLVLADVVPNGDRQPHFRSLPDDDAEAASAPDIRHAV